MVRKMQSCKCNSMAGFRLFLSHCFTMMKGGCGFHSGWGVVAACMMFHNMIYNMFSMSFHNRLCIIFTAMFRSTFCIIHSVYRRLVS